MDEARYKEEHVKDVRSSFAGLVRIDWICQLHCSERAEAVVRNLLEKSSGGTLVDEVPLLMLLEQGEPKVLRQNRFQGRKI